MAQNVIIIIIIIIIIITIIIIIVIIIIKMKQLRHCLGASSLFTRASPGMAMSMI